DETLARQFLVAGCGFVAVGTDTQLLARATTALAARFKAAPEPAAPAGAAVSARRPLDDPAHAEVRPVAADGAAAGTRDNDGLLPAAAQRARAHRAAVARDPRAAGVRRSRVPRAVARCVDTAAEPDRYPDAARARGARAPDPLIHRSAPAAPVADARRSPAFRDGQRQG